MRGKKLIFMSLSCTIKLACFLSLITNVHGSGVQCRTKVTFIYNDYAGLTYSIEMLPKMLENEHFDKQKTTTIFTYGFLQTPFVSSVRAVVDAYLKNSDYNFMVISCDRIIGYNIFNAHQIAGDIADVLVKIFDTNYDKFHLVGFSLGAQIAGLVGEKVVKTSNGKHKIPRITGLDPGKVVPLFGVSVKNLGPSDAAFVDVIHAESKYFGSIESTGHVNIWINGGKSQPMCKNDFELFASVCSHLMALNFWSESVSSKSSTVFQSRKCDSYQNFLDKKCDNSEMTSMGLFVSPQARGNFYLQTNLESPYSKD